MNRDPESDNPADRPKYDGVELVCGWKVTGTENLESPAEKKSKRPKKQVVTNWEERTVEDAFNDVKKFGNDLAMSLQNRIGLCTSNAEMENFFDIQETFEYLCGDRLTTDHINIQEGDYEMFGAASFQVFFREICNLKHIKSLNDPRFDERLFLSTLRQWKNAACHLVWEQDMKTKLLLRLKPVNSEHQQNAGAVAADPEAKLMKMKKDTGIANGGQVQLHPSFEFHFLNHSAFQATVDEGKVVSLFYTDESLFGIAGTVAMTAFDIAMSLGGSEAIVESFYSVMDTQRKVRQQHATLEDRAILDWSTSNVLNVEDVVRKAAKLYIDGSSELKLPRHRVGTLRKKTNNSYTASQVLTRLKKEKGRHPFLT